MGRPMSISVEQQEQIKILFETTELTYEEIAATVNSTRRVIKKYLSKLYSSAELSDRKTITYRKSKLGELNPMKDKFGELHHNFIGEVGDGNGYLMVLKPSWYTGRRGSKHVFTHSVVMCEALGLTEIPKGFIVHHIDFDTHNNNINNLALMNNGAHTRLHQALKRATTISKESRE